MGSLMERARALISVNLRAMVDSALKANSLTVFDHYVREVEDSLEDMREAQTTIGDALRTLRRRKADLGQKTGGLDRNIDVFLREGKDDLALAALGRLSSVNRLAQTYEAMLLQEQAEFQSLQDASLRLEAKSTEVRQAREELQVLFDLARSKDVTVTTIQSLDDLTGAGDEDIARVAERLRARLDSGAEAAQKAPGSTEIQIDKVLDKPVLEAQLAERKAQLGLG
jgi:phage shock protein A